MGSLSDGAEKGWRTGSRLLVFLKPIWLQWLNRTKAILLAKGPSPEPHFWKLILPLAASNQPVTESETSQSAKYPLKAFYILLFCCEWFYVRTTHLWDALAGQHPQPLAGKQRWHRCVSYLLPLEPHLWGHWTPARDIFSIFTPYSAAVSCWHFLGLWPSARLGGVVSLKPLQHVLWNQLLAAP